MQALQGKTHYKKIRHAHAEHHQEEGPWIVSYADMMTLLFCFFVILTSFATFDPMTVASKGSEVAEHFAPSKNKGQQIEIETLGLDIGGHPNLKDSLSTKIIEGNLEVLFSSAVMFEPGSTKIRNDYLKNIDAMISLIKNKNPNYRIIVEGHTDDSPVASNSNYLSNWEISSARAASIIQRFEYYGFKGEQLASVGYGQARPIAPNKNEDGSPNLDNRALNRRVVIKVLKPLHILSQNAKNDTHFEDNEIQPTIQQ